MPLKGKVETQEIPALNKAFYSLDIETEPP